MGHGDFLDTKNVGETRRKLCEGRLGWLHNRLTVSHTAQETGYLFIHHSLTRADVSDNDKIHPTNAHALRALRHLFSHIHNMFFGRLHLICHGLSSRGPFSTVKRTAHQTTLLMQSKQPLIVGTKNAAHTVYLFEKDQVAIHDHF